MCLGREPPTGRDIFSDRVRGNAELVSVFAIADSPAIVEMKTISTMAAARTLAQAGLGLKSKLHFFAFGNVPAFRAFWRSCPAAAARLFSTGSLLLKLFVRLVIAACHWPVVT